ncbi:MAG: hypothetical protein B6D44_13275 [Ignavibacteriales bacterium UTCHB2]|jgi:hypothetical protein|nr:MAG: hypothetical protein B6D44_13275 [Ignavibacteriales bacterium UTCHB2]
MDRAKLFNFADFFFLAQDENLNELKEDLIEAGLVVESNQDFILNLLKQKRAELLIQTGRKFKENYLKLKNQNTLRNSENNSNIGELVLAYRKKSGNSEKDDDTDSSIMDIIKQAKKKTT